MSQTTSFRSRVTAVWAFVAAVILLGCSINAAAQNSTRVVVNRVRLSDELVAAIQMRYRVRIPDGEYWYDRVSGAWGMQGGPTRGFTLPELNVGGPLSENASRGNTGVFVNGRELHVYDVLRLRQVVGYVLPGRYWLNARGVAGYEGGPAQWDLLRMARSNDRSGRYHSDIGTVLGDGRGFIGYISRDSSMTSEQR
jgi:hypothetical protein